MARPPVSHRRVVVSITVFVAAGLFGLLALGRSASQRGAPAAAATPNEGFSLPRATVDLVETFVSNGDPENGAKARPASVARLRAPVPPMPTPISAPRSSRYSATPLIPDPELTNRVAERLSGRTGRFGVAIKDLESGRGVLIDPDGEYEAASLFKLWVMYEVFKQRELGALSFDETLVLTDRHVSYDLGTLDRPAGATIQLHEALERMITISDNSSAILLTDRVGSLNINQDLRSLGLEHTRLILDDLVTSPADVLLFLEMLARGEGVNPGASADMVQLLARQRIRDRIPRLLSSEAIVANKTGNLPGVVNDVGIVYGPGIAFVVAVLVQQTPNRGDAAAATAEIAATAYEHFRALGGGTSVRFPPVDASARPRLAPRLVPAAAAASPGPAHSGTPRQAPTAAGAAPAPPPPSLTRAETRPAVPSSTPMETRAAAPSPSIGSPTPAGPSPIPTRAPAPPSAPGPAPTFPLPFPPTVPRS